MPVNPYSCDAFVNRGGRIPNQFTAQFTALKTKKAKIADGRQAGRKKCTIDFGLTKELDDANFGAETETKTAERKKRC